MYRSLHLLSLASLLFLLGCGAGPEDPRERLTALIDEAETAVESRDLLRVMEFVDPAYRDDQGRDWTRLRGLLAGYFVRHPSIHILSKIEQLQIETRDKARVSIYAAVAGSLQEAEAPITTA